MTASNLGPQKSFPVPQGVLNHRGLNTVALSIWAFDPRVKLAGFSLAADGIVESSMYPVEAVPQPHWKRRDAY